MKTKHNLQIKQQFQIKINKTKINNQIFELKYINYHRFDK